MKICLVLRMQLDFVTPVKICLVLQLDFVTPVKVCLVLQLDFVTYMKIFLVLQLDFVTPVKKNVRCCSSTLFNEGGVTENNVLSKILAVILNVQQRQ